MAAAGEAEFPKAARLTSPAEFDRVFGMRQSAASGPLVLYACPATVAGQPSRMGLSVSRRIGNAVVRNRWKRRLREAFRRTRSRLPPGHDFVVVVRSGQPPEGAAGAADTEATLASLVARVVARPGYATASRSRHDAGPPVRPPRRRR